ncbi:ABC transporter permease [Thermus scotoductus]|uniref:ABC transporter permease n=2 Tax=Thermus TaxID=270 RepID=A0A430S7B0_THESC|nr:MULTISPECIES: ABC transporter permease [Thermus]KHG65645.1 ABC transporter [Thermus sp. 2.9]RTG93090.1 ABC transporter permease [Thermus scotoductus]RTH06395.1 ABC transporter permease [Thermus scotoductus]RTH08247.1 ABC transporter permease [Thermus scotoductus]RTH08985.1 ABC transporter permease [Thermus scotoductus]
MTVFQKSPLVTVSALTLILSLALAVVAPPFITLDNLQNLMLQVSIGALFAFGVLFPILLGGIDLAVGSVGALAGVSVALLMTNGVPIGISVLLVLALGAFLGAVHGWATFRLGIPPFVVTLAGLQIYRGAALLLSGGTTIAGLPEAFNRFAVASFLGIPSLFWVTLLSLGACGFLLSKTRTGRYFYAVGSNPEAARRAGVDVARITYLAYALSAFFASLGGVLLASRLAIGTPTAAMGYELSAIAAAVVGGASLFGGRGSVLGTFFGALLFAIIRNGTNLMGIDPFWSMVAEGFLIALVVYADSLGRRRYAGLR